MKAEVKEAYKQEIVVQNKLLNNLKKWLRNLIIISSLIIIIIMYINTHPFITIISYVLLVISIIAMLIIGLAIRNGSTNIKNILLKIEHS